MPSQHESEVVPSGREAFFMRALYGCARCHEDGHTDIFFEPLTHPIEVAGTTFTHWALCPNNGEPILLTFEGGSDV
jgi:hypothetical protein